jgi:hypothetical protein
MFFVDPVTTSITFVPDASTIFVLVFAALLVIVWCALALWIYSSPEHFVAETIVSHLDPSNRHNITWPRSLEM